MASISLEKINQLKVLASLSLSPEQEKNISVQFAWILSFLRQIDEVHVDDDEVPLSQHMHTIVWINPFLCPEKIIANTVHEISGNAIGIKGFVEKN